MKYVSPRYNSEMIETTDIICESIFTIAHVQTQVKNETTGQMEDVTATQVQVEIGKLF